MTKRIFKNMNNCDQFLISLERFSVKTTIGNGAFATIMLIEDNLTHENYAAKILKETFSPNLTIISILSQLTHPTIIKFIGYSPTNFDSENYLTLILEYAPKSSLRHFLRSTNINNTQKQIILTGISRSILYLHQHNYIHRDINPDNILIDENCHPRLSGFTLLQPFEKDQEFETMCGTLFYMAPEIYKGDYYDYKVDIYSFSILMFEVISGKAPFQNVRKISDISKQVTAGKRPELDDNLKPSFRNLINQCWKGDPDQRPEAKEIFEKLSSDPDYLLDGVDVDLFNEYVKSIA